SICHASLGTIQELVMLDTHYRPPVTVTHRDVGIGVSQVLPVLVYSYANRNKLIAIEQPEIHIHPKLQADLADVFIESALGERKNTFLLETHSEHLILRLLRRIRETTNGTLSDPRLTLKPSDISVLYVLPDSAGSKVLEMKVTPDGDFEDDWPQGFFEERAEELF
ncbi:MAG: AAA family ATPase, partial [Thaumarchaeota archaeon]|nr:AAA family ATPase [Nitrososphaerota archaeon]